jgi:hypothetical protein
MSARLSNAGAMLLMQPPNQNTIASYFVLRSEMAFDSRVQDVTGAYFDQATWGEGSRF